MGISCIIHRKQKHLPSELKKKPTKKQQTNQKPNKTQPTHKTLGSYFSVTLSSNIHPGATRQQTHKPIKSGHIAKKKYQPTTFFQWQISAISVVYKKDSNAYLSFSKATEGANSLYIFSIFIQRAAACPAHSAFSAG